MTSPSTEINHSDLTGAEIVSQVLTSADETPERVELAVEGSLPSWLTGMLLRNGPGRWEFDEAELHHWFDGMSMLHSFDFRDGSVHYANRFIRSKAYRSLEETGKLSYREFASDPCRSRFKRFQSLFSPNITDNPNVSVWKFGEKFIAMSEIPMAMEFDAQTLETAGVAFKNPDTFATAHPHLDATRGELVNLSCKLGARSKQRFFRTPPGGKAKSIASFNRRHPTYQHSFGMSSRWLIFTEFPFAVNPLDIVLSGRPFVENFKFRADQDTKITIVDRETGEVGGQWLADAGFTFHHVNAYEDGEDVVVDLCRFDDARIVEQLYLEPLRSSGAFEAGYLHRYRLTPGAERANEQRVSEAPIELPRINYAANNGRPYQFVYGVGGSSFGDLVKIDAHSGDAISWSEPNCAVGEPVFAASPESRAEDDGVLLSVVFDGSAGRSFLLVLDAADLREVARAEVANPIPAGFHGSYVAA